MRIVIALTVALMLTASLRAQITPTPATDPCSIQAIRDYYDDLIDGGDRALAEPATGDEIGQETLGNLYEIGAALQARALECGYIPANVGTLAIGADPSLERVLDILDTLTADPLRGQAIYLGQERTSQNQIAGCAGCHSEGIAGPATAGTWTRWDEEHRLLPEYDGLPFVYFAAESILYPNAHVEPPFHENVMPGIYGVVLGYQDLADVIAFLESQDQFPDDE